jgi:hypothetical protein
VTLNVYIYALLDPRDSTVRYVGLTRFLWKRFRNHIYRGPNLHFVNWITKLRSLGKEPNLRVLEIVAERDSGEAERKWITTHRAQGCRLLNYTSGGEKDYSPSVETREKLGAWQRGLKRGPLSAETRRKLSLSHKGRLFNPSAAEHIIAINKSRTGIPLSDEHRKRVGEGVRLAAQRRREMTRCERMT